MANYIKSLIQPSPTLRFIFKSLLYLLGITKIIAAAGTGLFVGGKLADYVYRNWLNLEEFSGLNHPLGISLGILFFLADVTLTWITKFFNMIELGMEWLDQEEETPTTPCCETGIVTSTSIVLYSLYSASSGFLSAFSYAATFVGIISMIRGNSKECENPVNCMSKNDLIGLNFVGSVLAAANMLSFFSFTMQRIKENVRDLTTNGIEPEYKITAGFASIIAGALSIYNNKHTIEQISQFLTEPFGDKKISSDVILALGIIGAIPNVIIAFTQSVGSLKTLGKISFSFENELREIPQYRNRHPWMVAAAIINAMMECTLSFFLATAKFSKNITENPDNEVSTHPAMVAAAGIIAVFLAYTQLAQNIEGIRKRYDKVIKQQRKLQQKNIEMEEKKLDPENSTVDGSISQTTEQRSIAPAPSSNGYDHIVAEYSEDDKPTPSPLNII